MYVREIDGEETTFGVSGTLWRDALVMIDRDTGTFWSQIDGRAIHGDHQGKRLRELPSTMTTWGEWKTHHPDTTVLATEGERPTGSRYSRYFESDEMMGVLGTANPDDRLAGKTLVIGIEHGGETAAVPVATLQEQGAAGIRVAGDALWVVAFDGDDAAVWLSRLGDRDLEFSRNEEGTWTDESKSVWDPATGTAASGPNKGKSLRRITARRGYWFIWARFHPETELPTME